MEYDIVWNVFSGCTLKTKEWGHGGEAGSRGRRRWEYRNLWIEQLDRREGKTKRTHHISFNPPPPHGAENFKMEHFLYWHIFLCVRTNIWLEAYSYLHYDLHISSLQENLNVLLIPFYSHIIRKQTKKCYDWICSQDTTRLEFLKLYSKDWWGSVLYLPLWSYYPWG